LRLPDERFRLHLAHANLGFAAANNLAAADCKSPRVATLNPDAIAGKIWLEELRSATLHYPGVKMFGSTQLDARKPDRVDGFGDVYSVFGTAWRGASGSPVSALPPDDRAVFAPCAAAALYARDAYLAAGGFDESFFCYLEDVDLGFRLALRGERCIQVRRAEVKHFGSVSAGEDSDFFVFHSQRNRLWVLAKNVHQELRGAGNELFLLLGRGTLFRNLDIDHRHTILSFAPALSPGLLPQETMEAHRRAPANSSKGAYGLSPVAAGSVGSRLQSLQEPSYKSPLPNPARCSTNKVWQATTPLPQ
jgi:GT2 family glycosyltransferase